MKFLLDVCVSSRSLIACLEGRKHDAVDEQVEAMNELLDHYASQMVGRVPITVGRGRIRIRR